VRIATALATGTLTLPREESLFSVECPANPL
jgi:hypothetical protein